ncbi:MAG: ribosomal L7Ae/L30e/S12e/Gadd45 family protein, partial [Selenomonadales bacterium]|nr:ribosomal L7Ae/L30e/S12e/Gadd45 family protein [Selenomonadales bacterium]
MYKSMLSLLGLAQKAGQLASGDFGAEKAIRAGKAKMILMAEDCADETKKKYRELAEEYDLDIPEQLNRRFIISEILEIADELNEASIDDFETNENSVETTTELPFTYNESQIDVVLRNP